LVALLIPDFRSLKLNLLLAFFADNLSWFDLIQSISSKGNCSNTFLGRSIFLDCYGSVAFAALLRRAWWVTGLWGEGISVYCCFGNEIGLAFGIIAATPSRVSHYLCIGSSGNHRQGTLLLSERSNRQYNLLQCMQQSIFLHVNIWHKQWNTTYCSICNWNVLAACWKNDATSNAVRDGFKEYLALLWVVLHSEWIGGDGWLDIRNS